MSDKEGTVVDLTQRAPRSPRVKLGGFVILPRMLDKARACVSNTAGEYKYNCPLDQQFLSFVGIDADGILAQVKAGKGDGEILEYILANCSYKRSPHEVEAWSIHQANRGPAEPDSRAFFNDVHQKVAPRRMDIMAWFDLLDVDDYASYGGKV